jgi:two-component system CheB/CheR fusion protein
MNRLALESVPVDLRQLVSDVKVMVGHLLLEKPHLDFRTEWTESVPETIIGDPTRLRQILLALVGNAIKFTSTGHIVIRYSFVQSANKVDTTEFVPDDNEHSWILPALDPKIAQAKGLRGMGHVGELVGQQSLISQSHVMLSPRKLLAKSPVLWIDVSDTGIGIPPGKFDELFKPFSQIDSSSTRKFGGTGLGLSIVWGLVQLMGGSIQVESIQGYGSTFSILLPVGEQAKAVKTKSTSQVYLPQQPETKQETLPLQDYKILVVDDVAVNRLVVETKLVDMGAKVQGAINGRIAVDLVYEAEKSQLPFDFVLMDLQMPIMDGFEATRTLRQHGFRKPIVALTANYDSRDRAIESGCDHVLQKPADREMLLGTITKLTRGRSDDAL